MATTRCIKYNSQNSVIETRVVDPLRQHYTWYVYNDQGLVSDVRTHIVNTGFGTGANPVLPTAVAPTSVFAAPSVSYTYTKRNEIEEITYGSSGVVETRAYNSRGWLSNKSAGYISTSSAMPLFSQDYYYNGFGQIVYVAELGEALLTTDQYLYDALGRLLWDRSNPAALQQFTYDNVGNRTVLNLPITSTGQTLAYKSLPATFGPNQLDKVTSYPVGPGVLNKFEQTYTYDLNGATLSRTTNTKNNHILTQVLETFGYNPAGLPITYTRRKAVGEGTDFGLECAPNATDNLPTQWMYRYSPLQEREVKRQTLNSAEITDSLAHVHYLLGADKQQLAVWNGLEKMPCTGNVSWRIIIRHFSPGNTRIITRPNGAAEFLITDHLGSTRLSIKANHLPTELTPTVYQDTKYYAFGDVRESDGQGARTGYIGREVDSESDLGSYGVRHYESATGRFLSTDPLWELYQGWNPYQYSLNNPVTLLDNGGKSVTAFSDDSKKVFASAMMKEFGLKVTFDENHQAVVADADLFASSEAIGGATGPKDYSEELSMIIDMIGSEEKDIQFQVVTETPSSPEAKFLTDDNTVIKKNFSIEPGNGEKFISHEDASRSAVLLFNAKDAETTQYKGFAGNLTPTGAGVSILLHGLLDHGYQWFKKGHDPSRNEGVDFQNRSIIRMGAPALIRNGADHADD